MTTPITFINAYIIDPEKNSENIGSLSVEDGIITNLGGSTKGLVIDCEKKCLAPGIIDIGVNICEPGERHKESFSSAGRAASAGGVTTMVTLPNTKPIIDSPELLQFFIRRGKEATNVRVLPTAALTKNLEGKMLTEIGFLTDSGAVAFTESNRTVEDTKTFLRALTYAGSHDGLYLGHCQEKFLTKGSVATASPFSTKLGLPAVSALAEKIGLERELSLSEMADVRYHASQITTGESVNIIKKIKEVNKKITAGTSIHHLTLNESNIGNYRTFFKLDPPLREEKDREKLIEGLIEGHIDTVSSYHSPQDEESKRLPFQIAASGAVGLQTLLPAALKLVEDKHLSLSKLFKVISLNPAKLFRQKTGRISVGSPADLIIFDPETSFILDRFKLLSKSKNTPYDGTLMKGKVLRTFVAGEQIFPRDS